MSLYMADDSTNQKKLLFQRAIQAYKNGELANAESICRDILSVDFRNDRALHLLGVIVHGLGRSGEATDYIKQAIGINPRESNYHNSLGATLRDRKLYADAISACRMAIRINPAMFEPYMNLGNILRDTGKYSEAVDSFRRALERSPSNAVILKSLGGTLAEMGRLDEAITAFSEATHLRPYYAEALSDLGNVLRERGELEKAESACRWALEINPDFAEAMNNLGLVLREKEKLDEAINFFRAAIERKPGYVGALSNLASTLFLAEQFDEAILAYRDVIRLSPQEAGAHKGLGVAFLESRRVDESVNVLQRAVELSPADAEAHSNLSVSLYQRGRVDDAVMAARRAVRLKPEYADAHWNLAIGLLTQGNLAEGWREYEWRWRTGKSSTPRRDFPQPLWDGRDLRGETILLHAEQGLGDTLQFVRYAPLVASRGGRVILTCQPALKRLLTGLEGIDGVFTSGDTLPEFTWHCPLLSLPLAFNTELVSIPASTPYLKSDPKLSAQWKTRLESEGAKRKAGLAWAGSPKQRRDRDRSMKLAQLAPLAGVPNVMYYSLQKGEASGECPPEGLAIKDYTSELTDFADTAALLDCLDLVITVDTAVAHLAGAMGKPVWTLLSYSPDWRWLLNRDDAPWYPTMRLFRQVGIADWVVPIENTKEMLRSF